MATFQPLLGEHFPEPSLNIPALALEVLLGFMLSGTIQAFVSKEGMVNYMGDASLRSVLYSIGFGAASTSCSFGDIAATKTLFKIGAHIIPSVAFLIRYSGILPDGNVEIQHMLVD